MQDDLIAEQHWPEGTVLDNRSRLTRQQAPWSHFNPIDGRNSNGEYDHTITADRLCRQAGQASDGKGLGGFTAWRLPTDPELHEVMGNAYLASTPSGTTGWYREAVRDSGVDNVYVYGSIDGDNRIGVWCVTDESKTSGGE